MTRINSFIEVKLLKDNKIDKLSIINTLRTLKKDEHKDWIAYVLETYGGSVAEEFLILTNEAWLKYRIKDWEEVLHKINNKIGYDSLSFILFNNTNAFSSIEFVNLLKKYNQNLLIEFDNLMLLKSEGKYDYGWGIRLYKRMNLEEKVINKINNYFPKQ
jgi:hypothetical protein